MLTDSIALVAKENLPPSILAMNSPKEIAALLPDDLESLLNAALCETIIMEPLFDQLGYCSRKIEALGKVADEYITTGNLYKTIAGEVEDFSLIQNDVGRRPFMLNILAITKKGREKALYSHKKYLDIRRKYQGEYEKVHQEIEALGATVYAMLLVPKDYRYSLALKSMLGYIENGIADNWRSAADKFDQQLHRWKLEENSAEALEYQKFTAMAAGTAAQGAKSAAAWSGVSAAVSILRLFR